MRRPRSYFFFFEPLVPKEVYAHYQEYQNRIEQKKTELDELQEEEARYARRKGYSRHSPALPLYTVEDAEQSLTCCARFA